MPDRRAGFGRDRHIDASLIRANVGVDALVVRHLDALEEANDAERDARTSGKSRKLCPTGPGCALPLLRHWSERQWGPSDNGDCYLVKGTAAPGLQAAHGRG
jgi:hypothetical protein